MRMLMKMLMNKSYGLVNLACVDELGESGML